MPARNETATYSRNPLTSTDTALYDYDNEGQLASKQEGGTTNYSFDKAYRLTGIGADTFAYDGAGNRLRAVRSGVETRYIYDANGNLLAEADGNNTITRYYVHGAGLLAAITPADAVYCYHYDATGNTVAITDSSETVVNSYDYSPFSMIISESEGFAQPFKYVGRLGVMAETNGFYYMRARYYDPLNGRFISEDPLGFDGGDVNLYVYGSNNPLLVVDPWGLESSWATYGPNGVITGEIGIQPVIPIPNIRIGIDSPVGGVTTTLPFGSGGEPTTVQTSPSWNIPLLPGVNAKLNGAVDPSSGSAAVRATVSTPILGLRGNLNSNGNYGVNLLGPQLNFPLGVGVNAFIGTSW